jgi:diazepam-binding inhibitor (GABA receptor modulating acyl-CoA-binding protein)
MNFYEAVEFVNNLEERPSDKVLLELYGYFKQSTCGDNNKKRPGMLNFKGRKKWDSWDSLRGMSFIEAQDYYISYANSLNNS